METLQLFFQLLWQNFQKMTSKCFGDISSFFGSFYEPNQGILENIFYNEWIWLILAIFLLYNTGGKGCLSIVFGLGTIWIICWLAITAIGIEIVFLIIIAIIGFMCYKYRN